MSLEVGLSLIASLVSSLKASDGDTALLLDELLSLFLSSHQLLGEGFSGEGGWLVVGETRGRG